MAVGTLAIAMVDTTCVSTMALRRFSNHQAGFRLQEEEAEVEVCRRSSSQ
jgi:hypothetical protein